MKGRLAAVGWLMAWNLLGAGVGNAGEPPTVSTASHEYTFLTGYGITMRGFGATQTEVQTVDLIARFGWYLSRDLGEGWYRGRHELLVEVPLIIMVDPTAGTMTGGNLLGSWKFTALEKFFPYLLAGGGVLYIDPRLPTMGAHLNYTYGGGCGVQYLLRPDLALMGEYRYHHVSNAGTASPNEPLNSSKFLVGISLFR